MRACRHIGRYDEVPASRFSGAVCEKCLTILLHSLRLQHDLMHDAQDDTRPFSESDVRKLIFDLSGERVKRTLEDKRLYRREYRRSVAEPPAATGTGET